MAFQNKTTRALSAHKKAPEWVERRRFPRVPYRDYPATFVTQVMDGIAKNADEMKTAVRPRNSATEAYAKSDTLDARRAPAGWTLRSEI